MLQLPKPLGLVSLFRTIVVPGEALFGGSQFPKLFYVVVFRNCLIDFFLVSQNRQSHCKWVSQSLCITSQARDLIYKLCWRYYSLDYWNELFRSDLKIAARPFWAYRYIT